MAEEFIIKTEKKEENLSKKITRKRNKSTMNLSSINEMPTTSSPILNSSPNTCENCKKCICKNWRGQLTPQFVSLFDDILYSMRNTVMKNTPMTSLDTKVELYPGTNIYLLKKDILMATAKAGNNQRGLIRNLLTKILTKEQLLAFGTAQSLYKSRPEVFIAIREYLKSNHDVHITKKIFNNVMNHKLGDWRSKIKFPVEQEVNKIWVENTIKTEPNYEDDEQGSFKKIKVESLSPTPTSEYPPSTSFN